MHARIAFRMGLLLAVLAGCGRDPRSPATGPVEVPRPKAGGGDVVGNGGNPSLSLWLKIAQEKAPLLVTRTGREFLTGAPRPIRDWVLDHREALAGVLRRTRYVWTDVPQERCALAVRGTDEVRFYFPRCLTGITSLQEAAETVVHEGIHHLGEEDEAFVNDVVAQLFKETRYLLYLDASKTFHSDREGELVCAESTPGLRAVFEDFNGGLRVRLYRNVSGREVFLARYPCSDQVTRPVKLRCEAPEEIDRGYVVTLVFAKVVGRSTALVSSKDGHAESVSARCPW